MLNVKAEKPTVDDRSGKAPEAGDTREGLLRELDARVAERVMGWKHVRTPEISIPHFLSPEVLTTDYMKHQRFIEVESGNEENAPRYSTDIAAAMEVVNKMREAGWGCVIGLNGMTSQQNGVKFFKGFHGAGHSIFDAEPHPGFFAVCATVEESICRAALAAIEQEKNEG